jgi:hypothetical protein
MRYRKKPVVIDAIQFTKNNFEDIKLFTAGAAHDFNVGPITKKAFCIIDTLEGVITATEYDYIIKGVNGEFYPCKPDIFDKTYDKVD